MNLTNREQERLLIYTASQIATSRRAKGLKLNYPEAISIISAFILEGAREGKSVSDLMVEATQILKEEDQIALPQQMRLKTKTGSNNPLAFS